MICLVQGTVVVATYFDVHSSTAWEDKDGLLDDSRKKFVYSWENEGEDEEAVATALFRGMIVTGAQRVGVSRGE